MRILASGMAVLALSTAALAQDPAPSPDEIVAQATPEEWVAIEAEDLLVMELAPDDEGEPRLVTIQLMPAPFSQGWVENIRWLARSEYYDGLAVIRVQDNYVTQWGDPADEEADAKPLPEGLKVMEEDAYVDSVRATGPDEDTVVLWHPKPDLIDSYADSTTFDKGWPVGIEIAEGTKVLKRWPTHCYGMVGVARGMSPNTGDGSSLYTVIGHAPRHLDRNIALVGRVIEGMEHLSSLPRGKGPLGFYTEDEADKRTEIVTVRVASDMPEMERPLFEYLGTESETFAKYAEARANRRDPFFIHPAGGTDICNIPIPVRPAPNG